MVTASHNPLDYNGMEMVREGSRPVSGDTGLYEVHELAERGFLQKNDSLGSLVKDNSKVHYIQHRLGYIDLDALRHLKIVVNTGNGCAGPVIDMLAEYLPFEFVRIHYEPDGSFPHGIPNPLLPENRRATVDAVIRHKADMGLAWDGDFDRCFFFDENDRFIEGYYLVGVLAEILLMKNPNEVIIHDPRLIWNTIDLVARAGGRPIQSKTGLSLSVLVDRCMSAYPCSGEINFVVNDVKATMGRVRDYFMRKGPHIDETDGLSFTFFGLAF